MSGFKGQRHSDEAKRKIGDAHRGKFVSKESRRKMSEAKNGKTLSDKHKRKVSLAGIGRKHSDEAKRKIGDVHRGKVLLEESKQKIREAKIGKKLPEEARQKMSKALIGNTRRRGCHLTDENKQKLSVALTGRVFSEEHKHRISEALKGKRTGVNSSNWKGGVSFEPYCPRFNETFKENVRAQFNRRCFICGMSESEQMELQREGGKRAFKLSVHHTNYNKDCLCDDIKCEFVPLCSSCHSKTGHDRDYWEELIIQKLKRWGGPSPPHPYEPEPVFLG